MNLTKIDKAHIIALLGMIGTAAAAIIPSESANIQAIVVALGGGISALYPIVKAIEKLADSNVSARDVERGAIDAGREAAHDLLNQVDLNKLANEAVNAQSLPDLEALAKKEVQAALSGLSLQFAPGPQPQVQAQPPAPQVVPQ